MPQKFSPDILKQANGALALSEVIKGAATPFLPLLTLLSFSARLKLDTSADISIDDYGGDAHRHDCSRLLNLPYKTSSTQ